MADPSPSRFADLTRDELAALVPELLLIGQLIDRSGMAWCIAELGREGMVEVAIEEWMAASPIYTQRMQRALGYAPTSPDGLGDVVTIFKGLQLDIGAPPQFMDFRYRVDDPRHGEFWLDHCGALMDVEPMGESYVRSMCHDIEDPTFDATAVATNPRAQVRPVHRPPRVPAGRTPHCSWTVVIDDAHPPVSESEGCRALRGTEAANLELEPIDTAGEGAHDYAGPLLSDLDFTAFSHAALVRVADEVCLQMHLLTSASCAPCAPGCPRTPPASSASSSSPASRGWPRTGSGGASRCRPTPTGRCGCSRCTRCSTRVTTRSRPDRRRGRRRRLARPSRRRLAVPARPARAAAAPRAGPRGRPAPRRRGGRPLRRAEHLELPRRTP